MNAKNQSQQTTNSNLYSYHVEITQMKQNKSVMAVLLKSRIADFYKDHGIRINTLLDKLKAIQHEYLAHDENDLPIFTGEGENRQATLLEGKTIDEFNAATMELMNAPLSGLVKL